MEKIINDITNFIFVRTPVEKSDVIFIPGTAYPQLGEEAAALWSAGLAPYVLPSGRYSVKLGVFPGPRARANDYPGAFETEWAFQKHVLMKNGVLEGAVLQENRATATYQNAQFSRAVLDAIDLPVRRAIICCKAFHARRCLMYYQASFPEAELFIRPVEVGGVNRGNWHRTETGIDKVLGELKRCGEQFGPIFRARAEGAGS